MERASVYLSWTLYLDHNTDFQLDACKFANSVGDVWWGMPGTFAVEDRLWEAWMPLEREIPLFGFCFKLVLDSFCHPLRVQLILERYKYSIAESPTNSSMSAPGM